MAQEIFKNPNTLTFTVEVTVPAEQAEDFADAMTGDDDDVILAAEAGIRALDLDEVELLIPSVTVVKDALRQFGQESHSL